MHIRFGDLCCNSTLFRRYWCKVVKQIQTEINVILLRRKHMTTFEILLIYIFGMTVLKTKQNKTLYCQHHMCHLPYWLNMFGYCFPYRKKELQKSYHTYILKNITQITRHQPCETRVDTKFV